MRRRGLLALACLLPLGAACTNFERAVAEFDSVSTRVDPALEPPQIAYQDRPMRMPWGIRQVEGSGLDRILIELLSIEPMPIEVGNPAELARDRMAGMVGTMGGDLHRIGLVTSRLLWVLDLDAHPLNQIHALLGLEQVMQAVQFDPIGWHEERVLALAEEDLSPTQRTQAMAAALAVLESGWPATRQAPLAGVERDAYRDALAQLGKWRFVDPSDQRKLILALARGLPLEPDRELRDDMARTLVRAIHHGIGTGLSRALRSDHHPDLRDQTVRLLRRATSAYGVPFLLAQIARPAGGRPGENRYDSSAMVRRTLVGFCGQLPSDLLLVSYERGPTPAEFLYDVIREEPPIAGLQIAALEALAAAVNRPFSPDRAWADRWWQEYVERRIGGNQEGR